MHLKNLLGLFLLPSMLLGAAKSDLVPPIKRKATVDLADQLAARSQAAPLGFDVINPFSPESFNLPDPEELKARMAGNAKPVGDKDIVSMIAERIGSVGSVRMGGKQILVIRQKKVKKGDKLSISLEGKDYEVEITDIQPTTFSIRFNNFEVTRPISIKSGKTQ